MLFRGMIGSENLANYRFKDYRQAVFYNYPAGAAPILGLLSTIDEDVTVKDPEFHWWEDRWYERSALTTAANAGSNGPFADSSGTALATGSGTNLAVATQYQITLASTDNFRVGDIITVFAVTNYGSTTSVELTALVTVLVSATVLQFRPVEAFALVGNASAQNIGLTCMVTGNAQAEGQVGSNQGTTSIPYEVYNYTQIFRTPFRFSGTEMNTGGLKYDETGDYNDKAKKVSLNHMVDLENALLYGRRSITSDGSGIPTRTTGGIVQFLKLWEAGSTYGNPGATVNSDDDKRIIDVNGRWSKSDFDGYLARAFKRTSNEANEKLLMCGNTFLAVFNSMFEGSTNITTGVPSAGEWGTDMTTYRSPYGTVYLKTHPLFNINSIRTKEGLLLDVGNIKYQALTNRDTQLLPDRQANNADYIEHEYLTECGFKISMPESHMYFRGVTGFTY